ncbi:MAG: hypothetical protein BMS9Abin26_0360 [Gammaproteobacteria bacterium]|nr:MAG: hypothetical protein BMS9Abin26_0360 [Gammaproteobacteria bacterium]
MINPEFQRNIWLEFTLHRLLATPIIIGAVFLLLFLSSSSLEGFWVLANNVSMILLVVIMLFWGVRQAAEAVSTEIKDRTWDGQRMSAISPWSLAWGKLFGSTLFTWYTAIFCVALYYISGKAAGIEYTTLKTIVVVLSGLLTQAIALLASMNVIQKNRDQSRSSSTAVFAVVVTIGGISLYAAMDARTTVDWFGMSYDGLPFISLSMLVWLVWAYIGIYRYMRSELQLRNGPIVWTAFMIFALLYSAGFINISIFDQDHIVATRMFYVYNILLASVYMLLLTEKKDPILFRRAFKKLRDNRYIRFSEELTNWPINMAMLILFAIFFLASKYSGLTLQNEMVNINNYILASIVFMFRDAGIILFFSFSANPKRIEVTSIIYLAILYLLIPKILDLMGLSYLSAALIPTSGVNIWFTIVAACLQVVLVGWMLRNRWQQFFRIA